MRAYFVATNLIVQPSLRNRLHQTVDEVWSRFQELNESRGSRAGRMLKAQIDEVLRDIGMNQIPAASSAATVLLTDVPSKPRQGRRSADGCEPARRKNRS